MKRSDGIVWPMGQLRVAGRHENVPSSVFF